MFGRARIVPQASATLVSSSAHMGVGLESGGQLHNVDRL